jgi:hypothetical protein
MNLSFDSIMATCIIDAVDAALQEAETTPLTPGIRVGHVDLEKYGTRSGVLVTINETEATVEMTDGEVVTWETKGMVDVGRVETLRMENIKAVIRRLMMLRSLENSIMGGEDAPPPITEEEIEKMIATFESGADGIGGPDLPTPGCDCDHCKTFSAEQHEEARKKAEELGYDFSDPASPTYGLKKSATIN